MKIKKVNLNFEVEPFKTKLGFKGNSLSNCWQVITYIESENNYGIGIGNQNVLWSDADVFIKNSESGGIFNFSSHYQKLLNL